nr:prolyl oligopeptidase family serine peptidase [Candidatus Acidoferrales bacterium]
MKTKLASSLRKTFPIFILLIALGTSAQTKRPLTHMDYDGWKNIQNQALSNDGKFLAYGLFPQEGDGEVVVRNLQTGAEWRQPAGARPLATPNLESDEPPPPINITISFTADSHFVIFSVFPAKADTDKAKREKRRPDDMPKNGMVIMDLATGTPTRIDRVRNFQIPEKVGGLVAYLREPEPARAGAGRGGAATAEGAAATAAVAGGPGAQGGATGAGPGRGARREFGSDLVLRSLTTQAERTFPDALAYTLSKDGTALVYAVASHKEETNGLFLVAVGTDATPRALLTGPGKYLRPTWDFDQTKLAFFSDRDDAKSKQPKEKLYLWDRKADTAVEVASSASHGMHDGFVISDKGAIAFSHDGKHIFFGVAPPDPPEVDPANEVLADDKVNGDLWRWNDEHIQPMQKVRAAQDRNRTYRAVYHISEKQMVQLGDFSMAEVTPTEDGMWALGADNRQYAPMDEYDANYNDYYLVNTMTGERHPLFTKHPGNLQWSPDGKHLLYFADKNWNVISVPDGKITNLTGKLNVKFWREDTDTPGVPPPYGPAGWTLDGKYALVYDEFDVWQLSPDSGEAVNLTAGAGRTAHLEFRYARLGLDRRDPEARWIDSSQSLLLRATNTDTFDTGFYRAHVGTAVAPQKLIFAAKAFTAPLKAKDADVLVLTAGTFEEFPDLVTTDSNFSKLQKVSNANPQQASVNWATAEMIHYLNDDGVPLKGILFKPENFDPNKKYPMIVYIYEKLSQNIHAYNPPQPRHTIQPSFYASNGYLILEPDIVYTTGNPGQSALKCVLPAIDSIIARGFVDEKNVGIEGHSWGGYQIAYMITQTHRFKAVEAGAPVVDMFSAYDGIRWGSGMPRQGQYEHGQSRIGGSPWQTPLKFMENSTIFMVDRITTPVLILANDADTAVPWYQGIEFYLALRRLNKEAYMFSYNGEPHGLVRRPDQKDFSLRMQQYFDYWLKGAPKPEWMEKGIPYLDKDSEKDRFKQKTGIY